MARSSESASNMRSNLSRRESRRHFLSAQNLSAATGAALILGDNIFYGKLDFFREALAIENGACIFGYQVRDPERYGVVEFGPDGRAISLEEKPKQAKEPTTRCRASMFTTSGWSNTAGCFGLRRGTNLEITDLNLIYLRQNSLHVRLLGRGMAWLDTGTQTVLLEAANYIATIEHRQGLKVACLEEVALRMGFIDHAQMSRLIDQRPKGEYRNYLRLVADEQITPAVGTLD